MLKGDAMRLHIRMRLEVLGIFLSIIFVLNECKKLDGYKFPVYSTQFCPRNESDWNKRSLALNCNDTNGYTCLPNEKFTELLEFCYIRPWILIEEGYCLYLKREGSYVDSYSCHKFIYGCHNTSYQSIRIFENTACISIGNGCFLAEQSCKSSPNISHRPETTENDKTDWIWVVILIGTVVVLVCILSCVLYFTHKKRKFKKCKRGTDIERNDDLEEGKPIITNTDNEKMDCSNIDPKNDEKKDSSYEGKPTASGGQCNTIRVKLNIPSTQDTLKYYFENTRKSGGGDIKSLKIIKGTETEVEDVLITFAKSKCFLTFMGIDVTSKVYAWVIVVVLPINSALNPIIYTFSAMLRRRRRNSLSNRLSYFNTKEEKRSGEINQLSISATGQQSVQSIQTVMK